MSSFPGNIPSFTVLVDNQDDILAAHQNDPNDEITAIATALGNIGSGLTQASAVDVLAFIIGNKKTSFDLLYVDADTVRVTAGAALVTNAAASQRVMRRNTSTTDVDGTMLDSGGPSLSTSTRYYVYADADATSNTCDFVLSTNSSAPSGVTRYLQIGRFDTDSSGNIIEESVLGTALMSQMPKGSVIQKRVYEETSSDNTASNIPLDNTKPQIGEGKEIPAFSKTFVPAFSDSTILVELDCAVGNGGGTPIIALFKDGASDAVRASGASNNWRTALRYSFVPGSTNKIAWRVNYAGYSGTGYLNTYPDGTAVFSGTLGSSMTISEIKNS